MPKKSDILSSKHEILRIAYVTGTCDRTVRSVLRNPSAEGVRRMSKARTAIAEELKRANLACG